MQPTRQLLANATRTTVNGSSIYLLPIAQRVDERRVAV
jgi:hypothetical protein